MYLAGHLVSRYCAPTVCRGKEGPDGSRCLLGKDVVHLHDGVVHFDRLIRF